MNAKIFMIVIMCILFSGCAKLVVIPVNDVQDKLTAEGMFYALPKTVVRMGVKIDHTVQKGALYIKFASIFAPDGDAVCKNKYTEKEGAKICTEEGSTKEAFELQQGVTFSTVGEPDPSKIYMVKFVGGGTIDQTLSMTWTDSGLLSSSSASVTNRTTDVVMSGLKLAANIGTKAAFGAFKTSIASGVTAFSCNNMSRNDNWIVPIITERQKEPDAIFYNYCNLSKEDRDNWWDKNKDENLLKKATSDYRYQLENLVQARYDIMTGNSQAMQPVDLINKLDVTITDMLTKLYLGTKAKETWEGTIEYRPGNTIELNQIPVLHIDPVKGYCIDSKVTLSADSKLLPKMDYKNDDCQQSKSINIMMTYFPDKSSQLFDIVKNKTAVPSGDRSFYYIIPAQVKAELKDSETMYGVGVFSVAQLGHIASLPAERFSKTLSYDLTFIEATGGLKSFKLGSTGAIDTATVDSLSGIGGTIIDAQNTARKADKTAQDEITSLTRLDSRLKLIDDICQIQKKYGRECTVHP